MERKRDKMQIATAILELIREGAHKTRIVYSANLNFRMLEEKISELQSNGLIEIVGHNKYLITDKGRAFLSKSEELQFMLVRS